MKLNIDIETRSGADLKKAGAYAYSEHPDFKVLLFGYSLNDAPVEAIDLTVTDWPDWIIEAIQDPAVEKHAFNAAFERVCLSRALGLPEYTYLDPAQWHCTMIRAAEGGYNGRLEEVADALELPVRKGAEGTRLINYFSKPRKDGSFNTAADDPERWERFKDYNKQDVVVEAAIAKAFKPISKGEQKLYVLDQQINDRGVLIDTELVEGAVALADEAIADGFERIRDLTGVENPNSGPQVQEWLESIGWPMDSLAKEHVDAALLEPDLPADAKRYFKLRRATALASVKKYRAAQNSVSADGRIRGMFRFYSAHTGRWGGRALQPQNLPSGGEYDAEELRELVRAHDRQAILSKRIPTGEALKDIIRTVLIPKPGHKFVVMDFSAIEARVLAWLAREEWVLDVFRGDGKIYEATAARMFGIDVETIEKDSRERDDGKVATLAGGYQGWVGAIMAMGGEARGWTTEYAKEIAQGYRRANPNIVKFWPKVERAFRGVIGDRWTKLGVLKFHGEGDTIIITLPSQRTLVYPEVKLTADKTTFTGRETGKTGLRRIETYGGKLTENITQAVARDLLALALMRIEKAGYPVVMHVHDEVVVEVPLEVDPAEIRDLMVKKPRWSTDLPLDADGIETFFYKSH